MCVFVVLSKCVVVVVGGGGGCGESGNREPLKGASLHCLSKICFVCSYVLTQLQDFELSPP